MQITEQVLSKIEDTFDLTLYDWQRDYLLGKTDTRMGGRHNGNTFAYCIKLLLSDGKLIPRRESGKWIDEWHNGYYTSWFKGYLEEINDKLISVGFETRLTKNNKKEISNENIF